MTTVGDYGSTLVGVSWPVLGGLVLLGLVGLALLERNLVTTPTATTEVSATSTKKKPARCQHVYRVVAVEPTARVWECRRCEDRKVIARATRETA